MTVWEFSACVAGWNKANGKSSKKQGDIDEARMRELGIKGF